MTVERSLETLLVEVVTDEADGATEDEEAVEGTDLDVLLSFLGGEGTRVPEEVDEANGYAAVDVEDEGVFLGGCDLGKR